MHRTIFRLYVSIISTDKKKRFIFLFYYFFFYCKSSIGASETYEMSHKSSSSNELINESSSGVGINSKSSCSTIQPSEVSTSVNSAVFRPCDNVHALFQSLCEKGLLIPSSLQNETEKEEIKKVEVYAVDFRDVLSFRRSDIDFGF